MDIMKIIVLVMVFLAAGLAGCNTVEGFGKDVAATGEAIDDTADDVKDEMDD